MGVQEIAVLEACCQEHRPATLISVDSGTCFASRFHHCAGETVSLELFPPTNTRLNASMFRPLSLIVLSFVHQDHTTMLIGLVSTYEDESPPPRLDVTIQSSVASAEARTTLRIPLHPDSGLRVRLSHKEANWIAVPLNISLGGIMVEFSKPDVPDLEVDGNVLVELELSHHKVQLQALVSRIDGLKCALMFPEVIREGKLAPPKPLLAMLKLLEQMWLARRISQPESKRSASY